MRLPRWRKMTWVIVVWCVVMALWIVGGIVSADSASNCTEPSAISRSTCEDASDVGTGLGVIALWFVWFFGFIALSLIWFMTRPKGRTCPACGEKVARGLTACRGCGHDFAAALQAPRSQSS
jgi:lysylphosphatidylglycerol synthetase-like protein (DUF2156 family)